MTKPFYIYDNQYIKYEHEGERYCVHIRRDSNPWSPREWDNVGTMACWHRNYMLGDDIGNLDVWDYWQELARNFVPKGDLADAVITGKLEGIYVEPNAEAPERYDVYEVCVTKTIFGDGEPSTCLICEDVTRSQIPYYIEDELTPQHCRQLLESYIAWLPLYLYDHSGITMSTGPFSCPWDSGQVGFIWVSKEKVFAEGLGKTNTDGTHLALTEENWKEIAYYHLESEVELYDQYLTGEVYGYILYKLGVNLSDEDDDDEMEEIDSCWGFYGAELEQCGIADYLPGLAEAIERGEYQDGTAIRHTSYYYEFA